MIGCDDFYAGCVCTVDDLSYDIVPGEDLDVYKRQMLDSRVCGRYVSKGFDAIRDSIPDFQNRIR